MLLHPTLLLLATVVSTPFVVLAANQSGNSQAARDRSPSLLLTAPAELVPVSAENVRFSRLLKDSANVLQFSSISNDAPPLVGIRHDAKKEGRTEKKVKGNVISASNFGRRALDYDEQVHALEEPTSETKIVANPYPGNEYVYVRPGKLEQVPIVANHQDSEVAASVTSINNKPPRVPLAILRQKKGKRVNISPLFTEIPQVHQTVGPSTKEFVWVDHPAEHHLIAVNRQGRKQEDSDEVTTHSALQDDEIVEATTVAEDIVLETTTKQNNKSKTIVNIVTSAPRVSVESSVSGERKSKLGSRLRNKLSTTTTSTTTTSTTTSATTSTTPEVTTEATTSTTTARLTTSQLSTTTTAPTTSSSSPKAPVADEKENLVADASQRAGTTFHGFEDSQTRLQAAESNQPARVNVRPAQNGKEYEYEYIYYYYDDDDENNNGEKSGDGQRKVVEQPKGTTKQASSTTTTLTPSSDATVPASSTAAVTSTTTTSTSTSTLPPQLTSEADFEYEDDADLEEEIKVNSQAPELQKSTPVVATRVTEEPIHKGVSSLSSAEKLSNLNPINQLDRSRGPKILVPGKFEEAAAAAADYKLETEASQEEGVQVQSIAAQSKGQPQRQTVTTTSSEEDEEGFTQDVPEPVIQVTSREPSTSAPRPSTTLGFDISHMSTMAKSHKDSVNVPIILKQSSLLKAVPVSQVHPNPQVTIREEQPSTAPFTTASTTTTVEVASEAPARSPNPRLRGQRIRNNFGRTTTTVANEAAPEQHAEDKPQHSLRRPNLRDGPRRIPARRPAQEASDNTPEQQPAASPVIESQARPLPIRPRFPPRTAGHSTTTVAAPAEGAVSDAPVQQVTISAAELNSLEDKKAKDAHVRAKSANDLFAFARLQQAISSRAPSRVQPKLVAGFVNSGEASTDAITSSEVTTISSFGGQSNEAAAVIPEEPSTPSTTTTTEAVQLDKFGRPIRGRFGGRVRRPLAPGTASSPSSTEAPAAPQRNRFTGRRRTSTTEAPEGSVQTSVNNAEAAKPKIPSRNRFASRNRGSTTEAPVTNGEGQGPVENEKPAAPRRRPGFQGRRRPNQIQSPTDAPAAHAESASTSAAEASSATASSTASPIPHGRNRFNIAGGRPRPGVGAVATPGVNPIRIRGGGRLRGPITSTTTEAIPQEAEVAQEQLGELDQSQTIQNENLEQTVQSSPVPDPSLPIRGGVLGRLKSRPKLVVTSTAPPELANPDRKPSRLNGILNRRKNLGQLAAAVHVKEEVRESVSEGEEANNHAHEQIDGDHKGVVVQISSSVTESEEVNEGHAAEVVEAPSTTPGSILNRLKSQRKPGSLFRKKPDPHGE